MNIHTLPGRARGAMLAAWVGAALMLPVASPVADEGGVSFWTPGQYASLAAVPAAPGWSLPVQAYYYSGSDSLSEPYTRGETLTFGLESSSLTFSAQPTYSPVTRLLGGQVSVGLGFGYGENTTDADLSISSSGAEAGRSDSVWGLTDLYPVASLAWNRGVNNWMAYLTGDIPVGEYDSTQLSSIGIGHAAIDAGGGYTYFNEHTGYEFSAVVGFTYNWENPDTDYQNGIDSHLDLAASRFLSSGWQIGVAGYLYYQLTGDSGAGAKLGAFESKVAAIGPQAGYSFTMGGLPLVANVRGYWEFWAENRLKGYSLFATLAIPLGAPQNTLVKK